MSVQQVEPITDVQRIWECVHEMPDATTPQISEATGIDKSVVNSAVARMVLHRGIMKASGETWSAAAGRNVKTYRALGKFYGDKPTADEAPPRILPKLPPPVSDAKLDGLSKMEATWATLKANPDWTCGQVADLIGSPRNQVAANITMLEKRGKLKASGMSRPEHGKAARTYQAIGDNYSDRPAKETPTTNGHDLGQASPSPSPVETRKWSHTVWEQAEIEAVCLKLARDSVLIATPVSEHGLRRVAMFDGFGYRPREMTADAARAFVESHRRLIEDEAERIRKGWTAPPPAHPAPAPVASAPAQPSAPAPSFGALLDAALASAVASAVDGAVSAALARELPAVEARMRKAFAEVLQAAFSTPSEAAPASGGNVADATPATMPAKPPEAAHERPKLVVVVNALPAQFESVKRAFPDLDLRLGPRDKMPGEEHPDLVVSLVKFINHSLDRGLRKKYGTKYAPVHGASDAMKTCIANRLNVQPRVAVH